MRIPPGELTYAAHGWTREHRAPEGYRVARHRIAVGSGERAYAGLAAGIMGWQLHRLAGLRVDPAAPRAAAGVRITAGFGAGPFRLPVPCEVVWAEEDQASAGRRRTGFGYGTLPGHPEAGEESFTAVLEPDGTVWFELFAFSRHANWFYTAGAPVASACQRLVTRRYLAAARTLASGRMEP
ncbi:DUF1990 family protein [Arthrobacter mobilis]|uniref:DUF1990 domain-containing protein n=1 Tax=Arthrobacter mobilis TaxID=2724944 RepID=A0A7X6K475_9MICC|nr:DUF1990 domain-containing protein [Arthrobacter mobilis]NKX54325.1 DUF1990 domain-containing protein [Arthrobacter mobilis]